MDLYSKYKSPLGYSLNNNIDSYGVDHSNFTIRDELSYQMARQNRENQIIKNYNNHGITKNYPQLSTNFWGRTPDNNYGFGNSQISANAETIQNTPLQNNAPKKLNREQMYTPPSHIAEILSAGLNGAGLGILGSIERGINTATSGGYDMINDVFFDGGYEKRQKELEKLADDVNLSKPYKYANYAIDIGVDGMLGAKGMQKAKDLIYKTKKLFK